MDTAWPATDVIKDLHTAPDGSFGRAATDLYLQGDREHLYTSTILIAADLLLAELLEEGERLATLEEAQFRNLSNHNLVLTAAISRSDIPHVSSPAIRGRYRTSRDRILWIEGVLSDERIRRRHGSPGIVAELMERMRLEELQAPTLRTRLEPLTKVYRDCPRPLLTRYAMLEFVLEGTRQPIRERFGDLDGYRLVVAGLTNFSFPAWREVAQGCVLEYRLSEGRLSSGTKLVHCDFSFRPGGAVGRLTIARAPASRMIAADSQHEPAPTSAGRC
jgi:hypothetical protein